MNNFSNRLESLIKTRKVKKKDLAVAVGLSAGMITDMTKGRGKPSFQTVKSISEYFNVSEEWLAYGVEDTKPPEPAFQVQAVHDRLLPEEAELLKYYRQLCPDQKLMIIPMMKGLLNSPQKSDENDNKAQALKAAS